MIRFKLGALIEKLQFARARHLTITEIAEATGINRITLSKILNQRGYNTGTDNVDRLCAYFGCKVEDILEYLPTSELTAPSNVSKSTRAQRSKSERNSKVKSGPRPGPRHRTRHV